MAADLTGAIPGLGQGWDNDPLAAAPPPAVQDLNVQVSPETIGHYNRALKDMAELNGQQVTFSPAWWA